MYNVKLLHIKCCFIQFFNNPVALKNNKKYLVPQEKIEMTLLLLLFFIVILCIFSLIEWIIYIEDNWYFLWF